MNGSNFIDPVVQQICGGCYATATVSMLNTRMRIRTNNTEKLELTHDQIVNCDHYNQGCAGGFPLLAAKYVQDFGLTKDGSCTQFEEQAPCPAGMAGFPRCTAGWSSSCNESCFEASCTKAGGVWVPQDYDVHPYTCDMPTEVSRQPYIRVREYGYVGGYYGGATTVAMMREVLQHGPIVVGLKGGYAFVHYEAGIYLEVEASLEDEAKAILDFEVVDHSVLLIGWGEDTAGNLYWICKNSYGPGWGEEGFFRIPRGGDSYGVLSLVTAAVPVFGGSSYFVPASPPGAHAPFPSPHPAHDGEGTPKGPIAPTDEDAPPKPGDSPTPKDITMDNTKNHKLSPDEPAASRAIRYASGLFLLLSSLMCAIGLLYGVAFFIVRLVLRVYRPAPKEAYSLVPVAVGAGSPHAQGDLEQLEVAS